MHGNSAKMRKRVRVAAVGLDEEEAMEGRKAGIGKLSVMVFTLLI